MSKTWSPNNEFICDDIEFKKPRGASVSTLASLQLFVYYN